MTVRYRKAVVKGGSNGSPGIVPNRMMIFTHNELLCDIIVIKKEKALHHKHLTIADVDEIDEWDSPS